MPNDSLQPKTGTLGRAPSKWLFPSSASEALIRTGWGCWLTLLAVVSIMFLVKGGDRSVVWYYHAASAAWWAGQDLYSGQVDSFNYLPAFAVLFTPFHLMGPVLAGLLWRWLSFAALTGGFWRLVRLIAPDKAPLVLGIMLVLAIPGVAGMVRNGQATTIMTALMIHAAADMAEERWSRASLWLGLAVALKPLAIVLILLSGALYRPMLWRLIAAMAVVLLLPFLAASSGYVVAQYRAMAEQYGIAYGAALGPWSEFGMMMMKFGLPLPPAAMTALRLAAALATLGLASVARKRHEDRLGAFYILALSICYLMLFNPANEENTYGALAGIVAASAAAALVRRRPVWIAACLVVLCVALGSDGYGTLVFQATKLWFKPLACIVFLGFLLPQLLTREERA
ncbi:MAG TPA: glycosyltransferase family 87 protein [Candidatus Udaeobacter sp.]|nr:glycosyltransferase family 87 protein [Candidatus Udaeobacter sp.]